MTFDDMMEQALDMLRRRGRVSYRALKRQFTVEDDYLADLKAEILYTQSEVVEDGDHGLVWTGELTGPYRNAQDGTDSETRFQTLIPAVIWRLQRDRRITYRTLKYAFGLDEPLLEEIREELILIGVANDEGGKVLVWTGAEQATAFALATNPTPPGMAETPSPLSSTESDPFPLMTTQDSPSNGPTAFSEDSPPDVPSEEAIITPEAVRSFPEAERRQLTVMFCDLVGSTDLSGKLDPEHLREVVKAYQETAAEVIQRYEGHIAQYLGDGLLIYFGFPLAHEDDAQRAVYTGLEIPEAVATLNTKLQAEYGVELAVRIGIHTGPVVVGEMGGGGRHENLALGETPNIAARLEGLAQANTVVISPVTAQLVQRSLILEELGPHELKGVAEPMLLYAVVGPRESESDDHEDMLSGGFEALVGRDEEIGLLLRRWKQSKEGQGQVVLISGEAGLGKSSLVEGLRAYVHQEGHTRIAFRCSPYTTNSALHPVIEHLQRLFDWQHEDSNEIKLAKLEQVLQGMSLPLEESVPLVASLLSLPLPDGRYPRLSLSPQQQRQQTQDVLVAWMLEEAEQQPLLVVWEDLHWADASTLELIGLFIEQCATVPMMNVLAYRPTLTPPWPMQSHLTPITLNRLERSHIDALVTRLAGGRALPAEVVQHIVTKTDGVPLYVEELTKMLLESDLLEEEGEQYVMTGPLSEATIPATLQDSLMARLDQLKTAKEVAQLGAVLGREFSYEMLKAISSQDEETMQSGLGQLVAAELLYQRGRLPRAKYMFKHALVQDTAYASLLKSRRQDIHFQIAELLTSRFPETAQIQPELVAHHYLEAGQHDPASVYCQRAGELAHQRSGYTEAINHLRTGVKVLQMCPESLERAQRELEMQVMLGSAVMATQGYAVPEVGRIFTRALELGQQVGQTTQLGPVLAGLRRHYQVRGEHRAARATGEQLLQLGETLQDPTILLWGHFGVGPPSLFLGDIAAARYYLERGVTLYAPQVDVVTSSSYGTNPVASTLAWLSWPLWLMGYPDQALQRCQEALQVAEMLASAFSRAIVMQLTTQLHLLRRDAGAVQAQVEAFVELCSERSMAHFLAMGTWMRGWVRVMRGEVEEGIKQMRQGTAAGQAEGSAVASPHNQALLAEALCLAGHVEEGLELLAKALDQTNEREERFWEAELYRLKGEMMLKADLAVCQVEVTAEESFQTALVIARDQQAKSLELRAATSLAHLWESQGKSQDAYDLLAPVYEWFTEGFDTADLQNAKALLDALAR